MAVTYSVAVRNNRLQQVINAIDGGVGNGILNIGTAGMGIVLSQIVLSKPSATIAGGIMTFSGVPLVDASADNNGTAAAGTITDSAGTVVISGLTASSGSSTDLVLTATAVTLGAIVTLLSGAITGN